MMNMTMRFELLERGIAMRHRRGHRRHPGYRGGGYDPRKTCPCCKQRVNTNTTEFMCLFEHGDGGAVMVCRPCYDLLVPRIKELFEPVREVRALEAVTGVEATT